MPEAWNKKRLHAMLLHALRAERDAILYAAATAREGATHEDAIAKSKYDTHGLELSYLAGSQFERARQAEARIARLEVTPFPDFAEDAGIDVGALVTLRQEPGGRVQIYLLASIGAGLTLQDSGEEIQVISPESPLGESLLSLGVGDSFKARGANSGNYEIIALA